LESKSAALVAAVFVDFPKNKCNFLHNNKLDIVRRVQCLTGRRAVMSFSPGAVATIAPWKSAPMVSRVPWLTTWHCPHLLRRAMLLTAGRAAIDCKSAATATSLSLRCLCMGMSPLPGGR